ncbi:heavy metal translocating P-type ATPase [Jiella sp. M17.18]|uniref:heavy metal translocating P-type ATPase n=1 Tax=Jiella sp. M17.18 TaxID=3234247 RepID=UPI0034DFDE63
MSQTELESRYRVSGMDCPSCAAKIDAAVKGIKGVEDVSVSVVAGSLTIGHRVGFSDESLMKRVRKLGYGIEPFPEKPDQGGAEGPVVSDQCGSACCGHSNGDEADTIEHRHDAAEAALHRHAPNSAQGSGPAWWRTVKVRMAVGYGIAILAAYAIGAVWPQAEAPALVAALAVGLVPVSRRAVMAARFGTPFSIEMLMTVAAVGAVILGAVSEAAIVVLLFLVGEMLEGVAAGRARRSIEGLVTLVPETALLERGDVVQKVSADALQPGDVVLVRPGDRLPADGRVSDGASSVDESSITGESVPKSKAVGDQVFAGTVNHDGVLRVEVTAAAQDNTIAKVVWMVEEAQEAKSPTERFIERFSRTYTPCVVAAATLVAVVPPLGFGFAWSAWVYKGLAILLIGCPCALVISTPAAIAAGLSAGARRGLLMRGGAVLEMLGRVDVVALDKTGTLTAGEPEVTDLIAVGRSQREVISMAAALEQTSSHPLARAILKLAQNARAPVPPLLGGTVVPGEGVSGKLGGENLFLGSAHGAQRLACLDEQRAEIDRLHAQGKTVSVLVAGGTVAGLIALRDQPRPDAAAALSRLRERGLRTLMLTGDNARTAEALGADLGVEARSELLPQDKARIVRELQAEGRRVAKVGDGINDAPALATADVGIAMGGGADVALETADAASLHARVTDIPDMIALSRTVMGNIRQNIGIALGLKAVFLVTTVAGVTGLWPAILADTGATVLVTANAMRLLSWRGDPALDGAARERY